MVVGFSLTHRPPLPPGNAPGTRLIRPQGHSTIGRFLFLSMKNPMKPSGIEPATFRFVAQQSLMHLLYISSYNTLYYAFRDVGRRHLQGVLHILVLCGVFDIVY